MQTSAQDADRVYSAAIDKFEAILGTSQEYAPGGKMFFDPLTVDLRSLW